MFWVYNGGDIFMTSEDFLCVVHPPPNVSALFRYIPPEAEHPLSFVDDVGGRDPWAFKMIYAPPPLLHDPIFSVRGCHIKPLPPYRGPPWPLGGTLCRGPCGGSSSRNGLYRAFDQREFAGGLYLERGLEGLGVAFSSGVALSRAPAVKIGVGFKCPSGTTESRGFR